jgi:hypothetical protein
MKTERQHPESHKEDGSLETSARDEWLGGEAHVRFQRGRSWRDLVQRHGTGVSGFALAFLVGIAVGSGMTILTRLRR